MKLRELLERRAVGFISGGLFFTALVLFPNSTRGFQGPGDPNIAALQLSWNVDNFVEILGIWLSSNGLAAIDALRSQLSGLDVMFALSYAFFGGALIARAWPSGEISDWYIAAPLAASVADLAENGFLLIALRDLPPVEPGAIASEAVIAASLFASLKFLLLFGSASLILIGLIRCRCRGRNSSVPGKTPTEALGVDE